jgi:hypothetical protein
MKVLNFKLPVASFILIQLLVLFSGACKQPLPKDEAEKHLRAFDNELISFMNGLQGTRSFLILEEIFAVKDLPLPFFAHHSLNPGKIQKFDFETHKGVYEFDSIGNTFKLSGNSDSIVILYRQSKTIAQPVKLIMTDYNEEASSSSLMFPTSINASLYIGDKRTVHISHIARVEHQLPLEGKFEIVFENFYLHADLSSRLRKDFANLTFNFTANRDTEQKIHWLLKSKVGMADDGVFLIRSLSSHISVFPLFVEIDVDNDAISSDAVDLMNEYNQHSNIEVFRLKDLRKVGRVELKTREASDKLNYALYYEDGSFVFIEDILLTFKQILNIKK